MAVSVGAAVLAATSACSTPADSGGGSTSPYEVKLGYFPNLTHAPAIVGLDKGFFDSALQEDGASLTTQTFNSGSDTVKALLGGGLDATFIGPSPAITAYVTSGGSGVKVVSGATSGGASLVVQPAVGDLADLAGQKVATPGLANTQDVAARSYFAEKGYVTDKDGGGDISIVPQDNGTTLKTFAAGEIKGAWVPEPYASLLVAQGGKVLVDEKDLWPDGRFVTTQLLVRTQFLEEHPDLVADLVEGTVDAVEWITENSDSAKSLVGAKLEELTQNAIEPATLDSAWSSLTFTEDPIPSSLEKDAEDADELGLLSGTLPPMDGIYDLDALNAILRDKSLPEVSVG